MNAAIGNIDLGLRGRLLWLAAAMLIGIASQYCSSFGACTPPV